MGMTCTTFQSRPKAIWMIAFCEKLALPARILLYNHFIGKNISRAVLGNFCSFVASGILWDTLCCLCDTMLILLIKRVFWYCYLVEVVALVVDCSRKGTRYSLAGDMFHCYSHWRKMWKNILKFHERWTKPI